MFAILVGKEAAVVGTLMEEEVDAAIDVGAADVLIVGAAGDLVGGADDDLVVGNADVVWIGEVSVVGFKVVGLGLGGAVCSTRAMSPACVPSHVSKIIMSSGLDILTRSRFTPVELTDVRYKKVKSEVSPIGDA